MTKLRNWRTYAWYKPNDFAFQGDVTETDLRRQADEYLAWLIRSGKIVATDPDIAAKREELQRTIEWNRERVEAARVHLSESKLSVPRRQWLREAEDALATAEDALEDRKQIAADALRDKANAHIASMATAGLLSRHNGGEVKTYQRKEILIGDGGVFGGARIAVRVVPCFTKEAGIYMRNNQFAGASPVAYGFDRTGGSGVTTYWVMREGRMVDSYLTQARAVAKARQLAGI